MFVKGDFVVNSTNGICEIADVVNMNMSGVDKQYYMLVPVEEKTAKVYIPVDVAENQLHAELAFSIGEEKQNIKSVILEYVEK